MVFTNPLSTLQSVTSLGSIVVYQFQTEWVFLISATFVGQPHRVVHTSNGFLINFNLFKRHDAKLLICNEYLGSLHSSGSSTSKVGNFVVNQVSCSLQLYDSFWKIIQSARLHTAGKFSSLEPFTWLRYNLRVRFFFISYTEAEWTTDNRKHVMIPDCSLLFSQHFVF